MSWTTPSFALAASARNAHQRVGSASAQPVSGRPRAWPGSHWGLQPQRGVVMSRLKPKHRGGKLKTPTSYKERFKIMGSGVMMRMRPGHRHKRTAKSKRQNRDLRRAVPVHVTYAKTLRKLGLDRRTFA